MPRGGIRKTHSQFQQEFCERAGDEYTLLSKYIDYITKVEVIHNKCGYKYMVTPSHFLTGTRCPSCFGKNRKTTEQYKKEVYDIFGNEYEILSEYVNAKTKVTVKHNLCNYVYEVAPFSILKGHGCQRCFGSMKYTNDEFIEKVFELVGNEYSVLSSYNGWDGKVRFKHNSCGHEYEAGAGKFLFGRRCPSCAGNIQKTNEQFIKQLKELVGEEYTLVSKYISAKERVRIKHNCCFHTYEVTPDNFLRGRRCRYCSNMSESEKIIYDFLTVNNIDFEIEYSFDDLVSTTHLRFDFMIKISANDFLLVEYDGKQHFTGWGNEDELTSLRERDQMKDKYCEEKGYKLIRIPYWESSIERLTEELSVFGISLKFDSKQLTLDFF